MNKVKGKRCGSKGARESRTARAGVLLRQGKVWIKPKVVIGNQDQIIVNQDQRIPNKGKKVTRWEFSLHRG